MAGANYNILVGMLASGRLQYGRVTQIQHSRILIASRIDL
jgi:hypothetical protein